MSFELEFGDQQQLEFVAETEGEVFWLVAMVRVNGRELFLDDLLFYPAAASVFKLVTLPYVACFEYWKSRHENKGLLFVL